MYGVTKLAMEIIIAIVESIIGRKSVIFFLL